MPQILPYVPSFGEKLMPVLSESIGNIAQGYQQQRAKRNDSKILEDLSQNPNASPIDVIKSISALSKEKRDSLTPLFTQHLKSQQKNQEMSAKTAETQREKQEFAPTLNRLEELIPITGARVPFTKSFFGGVPGTDAYQDREEFNSLGFLAADKVFTHFNKGTVSKEKLETIKKDLAPRANLSERQNTARINALRQIMNLPKDTSKTQFDEAVAQAKKSVSKGASANAEKGTKITNDLVDKLLSEANGDPAVARQKAKELGYSF